MSPTGPQDRPGQYSTGVRTTRATQATGREGLTGPTPKPASGDTGEAFAHIRDQTREMEAMFMEALVAQENRMIARLTRHHGAEVSAEMTMWRTRARRSRGLAITLGTALGIATTFFASAWAVINQYRTQTTSDAAAAATEAVAPTVAPAIAPLAARVDDNEAQLQQMDGRLGRLEQGVTRVLELLEPATEVHVPQARKRPR